MTSADERDHEAFAEWDAAYVLGALSPDDRHAYEDHLAGCARCRTAVAELVPLPGLLSRAAHASDEVVAGEARGLEELRPAAGSDRSDQPSDRLEPSGPAAIDRPRSDEPGAALPRPVGAGPAVRRERRHRLRRRLLVGAVAAVLVAGVAVGVPWAIRDAPAPAQVVALERRVDTSLSATVGLTPVPWGTRLTMDCDYPAAPSAYTPRPGAGAGAPVYVLVVTDVDGQESQVSTWSAVPGRDVRLDAATAVPIDRIASLEVRSARGTTLLSADLAAG